MPDDNIAAALASSENACENLRAAHNHYTKTLESGLELVRQQAHDTARIRLLTLTEPQKLALELSLGMPLEKALEQPNGITISFANGDKLTLRNE